MTSELLEMIDGLQGEVYFFVEDGPLKSRLIERYLEEEAHADILDFELDASFRIRRGKGVGAPAVECRLEADGFQYLVTISAGDFGADEITELIDHLRPHCLPSLEQGTRPGGNILRKKRGSGLLDIVEASKTLGLSHQSLKTLIPCSEIRIAEEGGNKTIEEYYWEKDLIGRFETIWARQKEGRGHSREDENFIAEWCCEGDRQWARDTIAGFLKERTLSEDLPK